MDVEVRLAAPARVTERVTDVDRHIILAAVDGTPDCEAAVRWAGAEAARAGLPLRLVHAWGRVEHSAPGLPGISEVRGGELALLAAAAQRVRREYPQLEVRTALLDAPAPRGLLAAADDVELAVLGSHRPPGLPGLFLGSVGLVVAARARCPVVLVPRGAFEAPARGRTVVGVRPSRPSGPVLEFAVRAAARWEVPLTAVYGWAPPSGWDALGEHERANTALRELERLRKALWCGAPREILEEAHPGRAARVLLAAGEDARMVVLGRSGERLGPVAREVCERTRRPVAVVPHG